MVVPFIADDLASWLISALADAGRKRLTTWVLGTDQERALRGATDAAVAHVAVDVHPEDGERAENLARIIDQVFSEPVPGSPDSPESLLEDLRAGISRQLAVLDDADRTGTGVASSDLLGVRGSDLADMLTVQLVSVILSRGLGDGPLKPLADQLNHNLTQLQGRQIENELGRLSRLISDLVPARNDGGRLSVMLSAFADSDSVGQLRYEGRDDVGGLLIGPRDPHLDALRRGGPLAPGMFWHSLWEDSFACPTLDVKVVNNTSQTAYFDTACFQVAESRIDLRPVPVIGGVAHLREGARPALCNSGWGPMEDCVLSFHLERPDDPTPLTDEHSWQLDENGKPRDEQPMIDALTEAGVEVVKEDLGQWHRWSFPSLGPFARPIGPPINPRHEATVSGFLEYTQTELDGSRSRQRVSVTMLFSFDRPGVGAPLPPSWTYDVELRPEGVDYQVTVPISQVLEPGEADRFLFRMAADKSSQHRFTVTLHYNGTASVECTPVTLEFFLPVEFGQFKETLSLGE